MPRLMVGVMALVAPTLWACTAVASPPAHLELVNRTALPILALVLDRSTADRVDPNPRFTVTATDPRIVQAGGSRFLAPEDVAGGYSRDEDVVVFVYDVSGGVATYRTSVTFPARPLEVAGYRMVLR